ncbi:MAG: GNAT family N-acetyltransferase [Bacteroidales bacterium]|nr:GNAT family N-acetyltransferase [Bacteroidales bacterium]MDE7072157.1 GNAT family N-acetyltransferase [Bacteroidales bacterium]
MERKITFRKAEKEDAGLILKFIRLLAEYERMADEVTATEELLREWIFEKHAAQVLFVMCEGKEVGFVLYFFNFSTFTGRAGLYVEDVFVLPEWRGQGIGKRVFSHLAGIARQMGCGRMEWICLDWNAPSIAFYRSLGAAPMSDWTVHRLTEAQLPLVAGEESGQA